MDSLEDAACAAHSLSANAEISGGPPYDWEVRIPIHNINLGRKLVQNRFAELFVQKELFRQSFDVLCVVYCVK